MSQSPKSVHSVINEPSIENEEEKIEEKQEDKKNESSSESIADGFYEVEKIMKHRHRTPRNTDERQLELFIKWKKYPESDNTWEPLYDLYDDIRNLTKEYFKERNQLIIYTPKAKRPCDRFQVTSLPKKTVPRISKPRDRKDRKKETKPRKPRRPKAIFNQRSKSRKNNEQQADSEQANEQLILSQNNNDVSKTISESSQDEQDDIDANKEDSQRLMDVDMENHVSMTIEKRPDQKNFSIKMKRQLSNYANKIPPVSVSVTNSKPHDSPFSPCKISFIRSPSIQHKDDGSLQSHSQQLSSVYSQIGSVSERLAVYTEEGVKALRSNGSDNRKSENEFQPTIPVDIFLVEKIKPKVLEKSEPIQKQTRPYNKRPQAEIDQEKDKLMNPKETPLYQAQSKESVQTISLFMNRKAIIQTKSSELQNKQQELPECQMETVSKAQVAPLAKVQVQSSSDMPLNIREALRKSEETMLAGLKGASVSNNLQNIPTARQFKSATNVPMIALSDAIMQPSSSYKPEEKVQAAVSDYFNNIQNTAQNTPMLPSLGGLEDLQRKATQELPEASQPKPSLLNKELPANQIMQQQLSNEPTPQVSVQVDNSGATMINGQYNNQYFIQMPPNYMKQTRFDHGQQAAQLQAAQMQINQIAFQRQLQEQQQNQAQILAKALAEQQMNLTRRPQQLSNETSQQKGDDQFLPSFAAAARVTEEQCQRQIPQQQPGFAQMNSQLLQQAQERYQPPQKVNPDDIQKYQIHLQAQAAQQQMASMYQQAQVMDKFRMNKW